MSANEKPQRRGSVGSGLGLATAANVVGVILAMYPLSLVGQYGFIYALSLPGVLQLIWLAPLYLLVRRSGRTETAKGILILAGVVFALNAGCWGVLGIAA